MQELKIMTDQEFSQEMQMIQALVKKWRKEGVDINGVRCRLMGYVSSGEVIHTPAQLEKIFDLGFEEVQGDETQTA